MAAAVAVAAILGSGFLASLGQLFAGPWMVVIAGAVLMLAGTLALRRRSRITPFPREELRGYPEPPSFPAVGSRGGTRAMDALGAEIDQMLRDSGGSDRDA
jgi:hypothetical protein